MKRVCILGSSPVSLSLAILCSYEDYSVDIFEPRNNFGGAWRTVLEPISSKYIQVYNNIVVPLSPSEQSNFEKVLSFFRHVSAEITPFDFPSYTHQSYSSYPKYKLDYLSLLRATKSRPNISFIREACNSVQQFPDQVVINKSHIYQKAFLPESLPFQEFSCRSRIIHLEHVTTKSRHVHIAFQPTLRDSSFWSYADEPNFDNAFDRSSITPLCQTSSQDYILFKGRVSRELKKEKLKQIIEASNILPSSNVVYTKQFAYISKRASASIVDQFNRLNQMPFAGECVQVFKTHALVASMLDLLSKRNYYLAHTA